MRIETYRSLVGRSATFVGDYLERRAAWIASAGSGDDDDDERCRFGRVDGIVVDEDAVDVASSLLSSSSCSSFGLACELRPTDVEDACDRLRRLRPARPLDAVVVRVPRPPNDDHDDAAATRWWTEEYLPRALPVASRALEEGLVRDGGVGRRNAHGNPASDHVHGVAHAFVGADLDALATLADVFPPTRFVLDAARPTDDDDDDERAVLDADGRGGLPLGLEAVAQSTDLLRVSPSTFGGRSGGPHGLLGPGTLFGEVQCAHEAQGATRTRVVLDVDDDDDATADLARRVRAAFDASAAWRAGALEREAEAVARRRSTTIVARGSAAALGLPYDDDRLTVAAVERRWRELAFRTHPDTADSDSTTITASFVELRRHYATLSQELRRREASTNDRERSRDADQRGGL